ncbi:ATP-binding cassette domain-containing protein [uncultured Propionibacterium sp.]|uniref:methionine ABC transporter ATP-binding protein n=1 Tax=uncultured Propionibacterium sp. TaxID=218066 RepID=UPI00292E383D|nr:ATP-binding cassette domain-containing protein [uncultured Propionibacterium sp.]
MIELTGVSVTFPGHGPGETIRAVRDVDLTVDDGDVYGIVGYSGAGKSTLVRTINLLQRPTAGSVRVDGQEMTELSPVRLRTARKRIGMIFQHFNLLGSRTLYDNVAYPLAGGGRTRVQVREHVMSLLELVGMADRSEAYPSQLSGGQRQRVAIARALANDPSVLLCDEATSALDPKTTGGILDLLGRLNARTGLTVVLITHEMGVIKQICSHVAVMEEGRIIERGSTVGVFTDPHQSLTRDFIDTANHVEAGITTVITHPDLIRRGTDDRLVSLRFAGGSTGDPMVAALARDYNVSANILFANVEVIAGTPVGNLLLGLSGARPDLDAAEGWLTRSGVRVHNYSDTEIESIRRRAAAEAAGAVESVHGDQEEQQ